ncbi:MAG: SDR family NAD(P)-dependent oxidoreductase, partial [Verrucomicrobia bacterium]|nr:SDR family NAD(P)-dependent oxidoreductase [Verrucomicrobiota bacterium]
MEIKRIISEALKVEAAELDEDEDFHVYGFDSISFTEFSSRLNRAFGLETTPALFFEYPTIAKLMGYLGSLRPPEASAETPLAPAETASPHSTESGSRFAIAEPASAQAQVDGPLAKVEPVAVIGMSGIFPGARTLANFWSNLVVGKDCISVVPHERWDWTQFVERAKWGGFIDGIDLFDAEFFGISPREAELMDPQQRLVLEKAWEALEDAGYPSDPGGERRVGLFVGVSTSDYAEWIRQAGAEGAHISTGIAHSILANRVSYLLNLTGPSEAIDTACSSSLVALHRAVKSLRDGECDLALAGGVNALLTPGTTLGFVAAGMLSEDGRCKTFDERADGYVRGEGAGVVVLKRWSEARRDGDHVYGLICGSAVNHGGRVNSLTAPNPVAQAAVIVRALEEADFAASTIGYIEAHGTGTSLGDPVEINGLKRAFGEHCPAGRCGLGTVKTNIGHLEAAAGIAGVIKVLLALRHRTLPANLHVRNLNPYLKLEGSPFRVVCATEPWSSIQNERGATVPLRAGVSSFGFGGANAHVVFEAAPPLAPVLTPPKPAYLFTVSARTEPALRAALVALAERLRDPASAESLESISFTLNAGRRHFRHRRAIVAESREALQEALVRLAAGDHCEAAVGGVTARLSADDEALLEPAYRGALEDRRRFGQSDPVHYREALLKLGRLYAKGFPLDWNELHAGESRRRVALPTYPFQRERYWVSASPVQAAEPGSELSSPSVGSAPDLAGARSGSVADVSTETDGDQLEDEVIGLIRELLKLPAGGIDPDANFTEFGFDSITLKTFAERLSERFGLDLMPSVFFVHPNLRTLSAHLRTEAAQRSQARVGSPGGSSPAGSTDEPLKRRPVTAAHSRPTAVTANAADRIAVVGMSGVFPGSPDLEAFWHHLEAGDDLITEVPPARWDWQQFVGDAADPAVRTVSKWGGFVSDIDVFDAEFFGISPREAELMDPQHRLFLMAAWRAIEFAGESPAALSGRPVGVFAGVQFGEYAELLAQRGVSHAYSATGNGHAMLSNRISYLLNLRGPSESVDTACSSALVALNRAVQSLQRGECCSAIVGAVSLMLSPGTFVGTGKMGVLSPEGRCKTFDASANGYVKGEGVGVVYLKRLEDAERDGNPVRCVICGVAVNHGGRAQSLTAPNAGAQCDLLVQTYTQARFAPETIGYVEAHGTGTELGDPVEVAGLSAAFAALARRSGQALPDKPYCGLGSVKTNIGHLEPAAGIAGMIKVILAMQHQKLPASLHLQRLNPFIKLENSPFFIVRETIPWRRLRDNAGREIPLRAGVSSFGFGGTNAHVALEEYVEDRESGDSRAGASAKPAYLATLSAKTAEGLARRAEDLEKWLAKEGASQELSNLALTLNAGRAHLRFRCAMVVDSIGSLQETIDALRKGSARPGMFRGEVDPASFKERAVLRQLRDRMMQELEAARSNPAVYREKLIGLAELYVEGYELDWPALHGGEPARRLCLPAYPFEVQRYWIPAAGPTASIAQPIAATTESAPSLEIFREVWVASHSGQPTEASPAGIVLLFSPSDGSALTVQELQPGARIVSVTRAAAFSRLGWDSFQIRPNEKQDYDRLVAELAAEGSIKSVIHAWSMVEGESGALELSYQLSLNSVLYALQAVIGPRHTQPMRFVYAYVRDRRPEFCFFGSVSGLLKSLKLERPAISIRTISLESWQTPESAALLLRECARARTGEFEVRFEGGTRQVKKLETGWGEPAAPVPVGFQEGAVCLITGGAGGLGRILAEHLVQKYRARLVLTGRSELDPARGSWLAALQQGGAQVKYLRGDISRREDVEQIVSAARAAFGRIDGVVHAAGTSDYGQLLEKTTVGLWDVVAPKAAGALLLDEATKHDPLGFFVLFSSLSAVIGISEGAAYAAANAFLDHFAEWREAQRAAGLRQGKTIAFNWPLWREGGMKMGQNESARAAWEEWIFKSQGLVLLDRESGWRVFERGIASAHTRLIPLRGVGEKMRLTLERGLGLPPEASACDRPQPAANAQPTPRRVVADSDAGDLMPVLIDQVCTVLKLPREKVRVDRNLSELGFDSISLKALADRFNEVFGLSLMPSVFFAQPTLKALSRFLASRLSQVTRQPDAVQAEGDQPQMMPVRSEPLARALPENEPIAVIGISGVFPGSPNLETFWHHLERGDDLISQTPTERWDWQAVLGPGADQAAVNVLKWGGFIADPDKFDARFFGITRREAELMDPQHRLMLQAVWHAIEDAGVAPGSLAGRPVGVFLGVQFDDYRDLLVLRGVRHPYVATGNGHPLLPNRVSFLLDLRGPSEAIDTACSSSLVALNRAVRALRAGECESAVAGGVSLLFSPASLLGAGGLGVLSPDGRCKTFDASANGYVKGEGLGVVYLMRLRDALAGGYPIAGLIRACAVNHGGKAQSFTAPNELAQRDLLVQAYQQAGIEPDSVSYIEAHGTGTELGDPVEIEALKAAFETLAREHGRSALGRAFCGIGSVKANIGHLEPAAGIASVVKVLLALRHNTLPGTPHFQHLNPYIKLDDSPFYIVDKTR